MGEKQERINKTAYLFLDRQEENIYRVGVQYHHPWGASYVFVKRFIVAKQAFVTLVTIQQLFKKNRRPRGRFYLKQSDIERIKTLIRKTRVTRKRQALFFLALMSWRLLTKLNHTCQRPQLIPPSKK